MSKFEKKNRLATEEQQKLLLELCSALVVVRRLEEAANLLIDLFSKQEVEMIAKRLKIARLLVQDKTYVQIGEELKVSPQTIARVNA
ncbi:MAG: YerC/YecD family TrpR-related protein, partial [Patescibacteria group bacterium]